MLDRLQGWDGEFLAARHDALTGASMLVGVHSTALGPGLGGTRMKVYATPGSAVDDVLRLSRAMTFKNAMAGLPFGGGKAVLAVPAIPEGAAREGLLQRYAELVSSLRGAYVTACDMNTSERDMDVVADRCDHVMGTTRARGGSGTSAPDTAVGVYHGIRAALAHVFGESSPAGRRLAVQGAGAVGARLVELLIADGADVCIADIDETRCATVAAATGATTVPASDIATVTCDVFAPCATGGVLNPATIGALSCAIVAGAANNQLSDAAVAGLLADRGIVYAPDYVVNAGGVLHLVGYELLGWSPAEMAARLEAIGGTLTEVFAFAEAEDITTAAAADRLAMERITAAAPT